MTNVKIKILSLTFFLITIGIFIVIFYSHHFQEATLQPIEKEINERLLNRNEKILAIGYNSSIYALNISSRQPFWEMCQVVRNQKDRNTFTTIILKGNFTLQQWKNIISLIRLIGQKECNLYIYDCKRARKAVQYITYLKDKQKLGNWLKMIIDIDPNLDLNLLKVFYQSIESLLRVNQFYLLPWLPSCEYEVELQKIYGKQKELNKSFRVQTKKGFLIGWFLKILIPNIDIRLPIDLQRMDTIIRKNL